MLRYSCWNDPYDTRSSIYINDLLQIQIYSDTYIVFDFDEVTGQFEPKEISHNYTMKDNKKNKYLIRRALYGYILERKGKDY